jgi:uncharacterized protein DUF4192
MAARNALPSRPRPGISAIGDLIAGVPGLLGFVPADSIVVIAFAADGDTGPLTVCSAMRADLPPPEHAATVADQLCDAARSSDAEVATAVVVCAAPDPPLLPHRDLVESLEDAFDDHGIRLAHAVWVPAPNAGETWHCYDDHDCAGPVLDPRTAPFASAATPPGPPPFASRAAMAAQLAPDPEDVLARRAELIAEQGHARTVEQHGADLRTALSRAAACPDPPELDEPVIARLGAALACPEAREECYAAMISTDPAAAERLWRVLTRALPPPVRGEAACLLAMHAYLRGDGVLAGMALDVANDVRPGHRLAWLLRRAIDLGTPPDELRRIVARSVEEASDAP